MTSFTAAVIVFAAVNAPTMLYAEWRAEMGFSATLQTLVYAIYVAGLIPGLLGSGRLVRRYSARSVLVAAGAVSVLGALALAMAEGPWLLLTARVVQGVAMGVVMSVSSVALAGAVPERPAAFTALLVTLTAITGAMIGPIGAGIIADVSGGTEVPMLAAAGAAAAVVVLLLVHGRSRAVDTPGPTPVPSAGRAGSAGVPARGPEPRGHLMISLTAGASWSMVGLYQSIGPGIIGTALGVQSLTVLGLIVATMLAVAGVVQVLSQRVPFVLGRRLGLSFLLVGIGAFAAMLASGQMWWAVVAAAGAGVGHGFNYLSATREMGELNRREPLRTAANMGRYFSVAYVCMGLFTVGLGLVGDLWGLVPSALVLLGVLAAGCVALLFSRNATPTPTP